MYSPEGRTKLRAGDWVEVRSEAEILGSLDESGQLDGLPFMPEMLKYSGQRFQVWKRAHKTCDTVNKTGGRRINSAVHLKELRCDGTAHGGCQAGCLLYWKEAWIKPLGSAATNSDAQSDFGKAHEVNAAQGRAASALIAHATVEDGSEKSDPTYVCQATRLPYVTTLLPWWDIRQYWEDYASGNVRLGRMLSSFIYSSYYNLIQSGIGLGRPLRWLYDIFQGIRGGIPFPKRVGSIPPGSPTPARTLNLKPGDLVRVRSYKEILSTLDHNNRNRGLYFDCEEVPYCGGTYRVKDRVRRIINEGTGKMMEFKTESVILDGVYCQGRYSDRRLFCPRAIYPIWREVWLERVNADGSRTPQRSDRFVDSK